MVAVQGRVLAILTAFRTRSDRAAESAVVAAAVAAAVLFADMANEYAVGLGSLFDLAGQFGASRRSALDRYAGTHRRRTAWAALHVSDTRCIAHGHG